MVVEDDVARPLSAMGPIPPPLTAVRKWFPSGVIKFTFVRLVIKSLPFTSMPQQEPERNRAIATG
jgi:hypothetical protein